jgi:hypothetical protein
MRVLAPRCRYAPLVVPAVIVVLSCSCAWADSLDAAQSAVWTQKKFTFIYQGFTTKYSCDGLRDKMREVLLKFGARRDLKLGYWGCAGRSGVPDPFPGVSVTMNVLVPADDPKAPAGEPAVPSHWKPVSLKLDRDTLSEAGECELVEQVKQKILPYFTTRNVDFKSTCVPHQLSPGGTQLTADVLVADPKTVGATASN